MSVNKLLSVCAVCVLSAAVLGQTGHNQKTTPQAKAVPAVASKPRPTGPRENNGPGGLRWFYEQRARPQGYIPAGMQAEGVRQIQRMEAQRDARKRARASSAAENPSETTWTQIGSAPDRTAMTEDYPNAAGRVSALAVDPRDGNVVYAGTAGGGVWKTTDGGVHWKPLTDNQPSLSIGSLVIDKNNPDTIYAGTGDRSYTHGFSDGAGILKSTDAGATWTSIPGPFQGPIGSSAGGARIASLAISPDSKVLLAGAGTDPEFVGSSPFDGVWRSTDGGATWTHVLSGRGPANTVLFHPVNAQIAYAGVQGAGPFQSTDGGLTWTPLPSGFPQSGLGRVELAISPSNPMVLYAGVSDANSKFIGFFTSITGGASWTALTSTPDYCSPQCGYDQFVVVHPNDPNTVFVGGSDNPTGNSPTRVIRSQDGGMTWTEISKGPNGLGIHVDEHAAAFTPDAQKLYVGNDGGASSTSNPIDPQPNWTDLNSTFATTQYYPLLAIHPVDPGIAFGPSQDNGVQRYSGTLAWTEVTCGDGSFAAIDFVNPSIVYANCEQINIEKSTSGGAPNTFQPATNGIALKDPVSFIPPMTMDPSKSTTLYFGTNRIWQTVNGAGTWSAISPVLAASRGQAVSAIAVAPSDSNTVYAGTTDGLVQVTSNATSGAATWSNVSSGLPQGRTVSSIAVDPANPATVYVTYSGYSGFFDMQGHVFASTTGGSAWTDISANLPNVPANFIVVDPDVAGQLFLATDVGVFSGQNTGNAWTPVGSGLPRAPVLGLRLHRPSRTLRAATYGRSMWDLIVPNPSAGPLPALNAGGIADDASFRSPVVPGSIAAVFGTNLATPPSLLAGAVPLPTSLAGLSMTFSGSFAVPFFYASATQANIQIPWELAGQSSATLIATTANGTSQSRAVPLAAIAPAIFTTNQQGTGQGVVTIANSTILVAPAGSIPGSESRPAAKGEFLTIYCIGLGAVDSPPATGAASPGSPPAQVVAATSVSVGGASTAASFSGLAPGFVGLYQVNAQVPASAQSGDAVPLTITVGGIVSNTVTVAVQ